MPETSAYRIDISPAAGRDLQKLGGRIRHQEFERLAVAIDSLARDPRPYGVRKVEGTVTAYRIRVGHYRIVYDIFDDNKLVVILQVARRNESTYKA